VIEEGAIGREFYVLYRGTAAVDKDKKYVAELSPGEFFGEIGFLVELPRTATVRAGKGFEAFRFDGPDFEEIVRRVSGLSAVLRDVARQRMRKLSRPPREA
jgi:CRP-like cAMP-binding protein